jgi:hypothetical protein
MALRERVKDGIVRLIDCASHDMLADVLTKSLPAPDFARHRNVMSGKTRHTSPDLPEDLTVPGSRTTPPRDTTVKAHKCTATRKRVYAGNVLW